MGRLGAWSRRARGLRSRGRSSGRSRLQRVLEASAGRQGSFLQGQAGKVRAPSCSSQIAEAAGEAFGASSSGGGERDSESDTLLGTPFSTWTPSSSSRSSNGFSTPGGAAHQALAGWAHHGGLGGTYGGGAPLAHPGVQPYVGSPVSDLGAVGQGALHSPSSAKSSPALSRSVSMSPALAPPGPPQGRPPSRRPSHYLPPGAPLWSLLPLRLAGRVAGPGPGAGGKGCRGTGRGQGRKGTGAAMGRGPGLGQQAVLSGAYGEAYGGTHRLQLPPLAAPGRWVRPPRAECPLCNGFAAGAGCQWYAHPALALPALAVHSSSTRPMSQYLPQAAFGVPLPGHHEGLTAHPTAA